MLLKSLMGLLLDLLKAQTEMHQAENKAVYVSSWQPDILQALESLNNNNNNNVLMYRRGRAHTHWAHSSVRWSPSCRNTVRWCGHSPPRSDSDTLQHTESRRNPSDSLKRNTQQPRVLTSATFQLFQLFKLRAWDDPQVCRYVWKQLFRDWLICSVTVEPTWIISADWTKPSLHFRQI